MKINYDVTIPEIESAFMLFWKKYSLKRTVLFSIAFAISAFLFIDMIFKGGAMFGGIGAGLSLGLLANQWLRPRRARKKLVEILSNTYEEKYTAVFGEEQIEIETIFQGPETENPENPVQEEPLPENQEEDEEHEKIAKSIYNLSSEELYSLENDDLFLLFVNKALIYVFPKRCLSGGEAESLREYFVKHKI